MGIKLTVRNCNKSCRHYLRFEDGTRAICAYEDNKDVIPESPCKYELLTESSARKIISPEQRLLKATFGAGLDITLAEARERLAENKK